MQQFQVMRSDYSQHQTKTVSENPALESGCALVKIDRFAFTANNITYAVAGDLLGYWQFYPAIDEDVDAWGVIPVWGFGEVVESSADGMNVGDRFFGYWPPAEHTVVQPLKINESGFVEGAEHRQKLPPAYNNYRRVPAKSGDTTADNEQMVLWPLFLTGYLIAEQLNDHDFYGAQQVIVLSASSKTSLGLGYALQEFKASPKSLGLTSASNKPFVSTLGVYNDTIDYDALDSLDPSIPTTIVDMAGNSELLGRLHKLFGANMRQTINVGVTHWNSGAPSPDVIADRSEMFFAPTRMIKLNKEWGAEGFQQKTGSFIAKAAERSRTWLKFREINGIERLETVYLDVLNGKVDPAEGIVVVC